MYPLKFKHIFKNVLWGGSKIAAYKNSDVPYDDVGESWEISTVPNHVSVIANGKWEGMLLTDVIDKYKGQITGEKIYRHYGHELPLLFKFIDTKDHCSVQVHPNDEIAKRRHSCNGKTEIWYVIDAELDSTLVSGFSKSISLAEYHERVETDTLEDVLMYHKAKSGDAFFIPAGRIHAIGKGLLVAEIQQSSDITYRVYDYGRKDVNGNSRELHTEEAIEALDFSVLAENDLKKETDTDNSENIKLADCEFFHVCLLNIKGKTRKDYQKIDSFVVYMCIKGTCNIISNAEKTLLKQGECVLIPASINTIEIETTSDFGVKLIECYLDK